MFAFACGRFREPDWSMPTVPYERFRLSEHSRCQFIVEGFQVAKRGKTRMCHRPSLPGLSYCNQHAPLIYRNYEGARP